MTMFKVCRKCINCQKQLYNTEECIGVCAECAFHMANGSYTIEGFNRWLKGESPRRQDSANRRVLENNNKIGLV